MQQQCSYQNIVHLPMMGRTFAISSYSYLRGMIQRKSSCPPVHKLTTIRNTTEPPQNQNKKNDSTGVSGCFQFPSYSTNFHVPLLEKRYTALAYTVYQCHIPSIPSCRVWPREDGVRALRMTPEPLALGVRRVTASRRTAPARKSRRRRRGGDLSRILIVSRETGSAWAAWPLPIGPFPWVAEHPGPLRVVRQRHSPAH